VLDIERSACRRVGIGSAGGAPLLRSFRYLLLQVAGFVIAAELAQRRFVQLKKNLAQCLGFRMPSGETLSVNITQRANDRVSVFVADFSVVVTVAIVETCFAHGALHCAYSLRASSCLDRMAILRRNRGIKAGAESYKFLKGNDYRLRSGADRGAIREDICEPLTPQQLRIR
jgi:hypothetical protein